MHADEQLLNDPNLSFEDPLTARLIYFVIGISIGAIALVTLFYETLQKLKVEPDGGQNKGFCSIIHCASLSCNMHFSVVGSRLKRVIVRDRLLREDETHRLIAMSNMSDGENEFIIVYH